MLPDPARFAVQYALPDGAPSRAKKDLKKLCKKKRTVCAQFELRLRRLATGDAADGKLSRQKFEWLSKGDGIYEVKVTIDEGVYRLFGFKDGNVYWLTHCEEKSDSDQWYAEQIAVAQGIRNRHQPPKPEGGKA